MSLEEIQVGKLYIFSHKTCAEDKCYLLEEIKKTRIPNLEEFYEKLEEHYIDCCLDGESIKLNETCIVLDIIERGISYSKLHKKYLKSKKNNCYNFIICLFNNKLFYMYNTDFKNFAEELNSENTTENK